MRIREIPYNYTSFSDREIIIRFLGEKMWDTLNQLRGTRRTGRSARMLFEVLGDMWIVTRNPLLQDDLIKHPKRLNSLLHAMQQRLNQIDQRADGNPLVMELVTTTQTAVHHFFNLLNNEEERRKKALKQLSRHTHPDNIDFSGIARVAHVTDATDWRVEYPFVIINPDDQKETAPLVKTCTDLGLTIIPRGGGTGYTGSGVPLFPDTAIINVEKFDTIGPVEYQSLPNHETPVPTITVGAGAVTKRVSEAAEAQGLVFAVDPTSQNASTIGGNIAMNAGGKKAVLWGTTLDNLLSWHMVTPNGTWAVITRINHNLGKIHEIPEARFRVDYFASDGITPAGETQEITLPSHAIRKPGLGKDVTNKVLGGLPGVQKEGCDGLITQATFILHRMPAHVRTVCLEFFGNDLSKAVPAIVETRDFLNNHPQQVLLAGLEHLDERYVKAIGYGTKSSRGQTPKMVLLADMAADDEAAVDAAARHVVALAEMRDGEGFIAASRDARDRFWRDRSRTAAIAAHTNAFKINEDVVIPLESLGEYSREIERINIECSMTNKLAMIDAMAAFFTERQGLIPFLPDKAADTGEGQEILTAKIDAALGLLALVKGRWQEILSHLDNLAHEHPVVLDGRAKAAMHPDDRLLSLLLRRDLVISYRKEVERPLKALFAGDEWDPLRRRFDAIHAELRTSRLFVALHMHAGDGNVHTNIPVNSNDYDMLRQAERMVERVMKLALRLNGAITGEHGVGLTKFGYLDPARVADFKRYKDQVDPNGHFNRGKLLPGSGLHNAYTPSLRLVQQEALILREKSELGELNDAFRHCLRCGKCKPVCSTHVPRANLLYSPRNKILATGLIIEAFLYEEQTRRGVSIHHFDEMNDVADHCTVCHKCVTPCPVNIDFGAITMRMRSILLSGKKKRSNAASRLSQRFLSVSDARVVRAMRKVFIQWGYAGQRLGHGLASRFPGLLPDGKSPKSTCGAPSFKTEMLHMLGKPLPGNLPSRTARAILGLEDDGMIPILRDPGRMEESSLSVFYFPGCGCERLFSDVSLAVIALLYHQGARVILPPGYLCCGFPQLAYGNEAQSRDISIANRVLFHRVANTLNYLDIKTVLTSCGTCLDQVSRYRFDRIFPGSRLLDIHEYLMEQGVVVDRGGEPGHFLYHDPCHAPMKVHPPLKVAETLLDARVTLSDRCCGEAGTFAVARPDIATQVRFRKQEEIERGLVPPIQRILTACPACVQGLSRYREDVGVGVDFIVVELARRVLGEQWRDVFLQAVQRGGIERVLL